MHTNSKPKTFLPPKQQTERTRHTWEADTTWMVWLPLLGSWYWPSNKVGSPSPQNTPSVQTSQADTAFPWKSWECRFWLDFQGCFFTTTSFLSFW